jgi:DivIVA domain-containing protein
MALTPTDVRNVGFSKPPLGKRGYSEDEVDAFLDLVCAELTRLNDENNELRRQLEQRDRQLRAATAETRPPAKAQTPTPTPPSRDYDTQAAKVLGMAQQIADRLTTDAKVEATGILGEARTKSERLLSEARVKADDMINEARSRAQTMINNAHSKAEILERQSQEKAAALEHDATRRHAEIIGSISHEKVVLERKVEELRTFESEYRSRLATYLQAQLRELDLRGYTSSASVTPAQQDVPTTGFAAAATAGVRSADDPQIGPGAADVTRIPAPRNGSSNGSHVNDPAVMSWEPAV